MRQNTPGAILPSAKHFQTTAERHHIVFFSSGHIKKIISQVTIILWGKIYAPVLHCEQNIHFWSYFATSQTWLAELVTWQVWTAWLSQLTVTSVNGSVWWTSNFAFSAGKLWAASCLHCVNCMPNPCFFTYCTCHVTISTSCVWLKVKCALKGWFNLLWLLQSIAISRNHSSLTFNQKMHKQQTRVAYKSAYSLCRHLCLQVKAMRKAL